MNFVAESYVVSSFFFSEYLFNIIVIQSIFFFFLCFRQSIFNTGNAFVIIENNLHVDFHCLTAYIHFNFHSQLLSRITFFFQLQIFIL